MAIDPITQYILQEFQVGYTGKYAARTADYIRSQMNKDPNQLSFFRMKRGEVLVGATIAAAILVGMSIKLYKRYATKIGKSCHDYSSGSYKHKICASEVRITGRKKQLALLTNKVTQCKDTKDPTKCKSKVKKHIDSVKDKIKKLEIRKKEYQDLIK